MHGRLWPGLLGEILPELYSGECPKFSEEVWRVVWLGLASVTR